MAFDLAIVESENGGELQMVSGDLAVVKGIENMPYLAMFGGNPGFISKNKVQEEQSFDWWGNNLLMPSEQDIQFNSAFEHAMNTTPLTSSGRITLENAIKRDLKFLQSVAVVEISVIIVATDCIQIVLKVKLNNDTKVIIVNYKKSADGVLVLGTEDGNYFGTEDGNYFQI